jgi:hypothetical protein
MEERQGGVSMWLVSHKYDRDGARLADGHYSRRTVGSPQFMPPGETLVLVTPARDAMWGWWRPYPGRGVKAMNGLDGWTCSIFRNTSPILSSDLVLAAEVELVEAERRGDLAAPCGPDGLLTYVWPSKIRSTNPGWCFQVAGWIRAGWGKKKGKQRKRLLRKPLLRLAGVAACEFAWRLDMTPSRDDRVAATPVVAPFLPESQ